MHRRQVLAALGTTIVSAGCIAVAGSADSGDQAPSATAESGFTVGAPTVSPGETASITVTARSAVRLRFSEIPDGDLLVEYGDATFAPSPTATWQRRPPTWEWTPPVDVDGDVPLSVPATVEPGEYTYTVSLQRDGRDEETTETVTVTVEE